MVLLDVRETVVHKSTLTSIVSLGLRAVNQVLQTEDDIFNRRSSIAGVCSRGDQRSTVSGVMLTAHLLRQADQSSSRLEVLTLQGSSGRESPAGTALALVLHRGDVALLPPVN